MVRVMSAEGRASLSRARKGKPASEAQLAALTKARASSTPGSRAKQAASLSKAMKGQERTPAQKAVFYSARAKAHSNMLSAGPSGLPTGVGLYAFVGETLRERDGDLCQLCLNLIDFGLPIRTAMSRSVDHILPTQSGGSDDLSNLWLAHTVCNQRKGARHHGRKDGTTDVRK